MVTNINEALAFVKREGPIIPFQLATYLNTNILFASAILSELTSKNDIFITSVKRGGSPFYYAKGQEWKLQNLNQYLPGKLKEAYDLIFKEKVLRDLSLLPWQRVALRELKDYAVQLNVGLSSGYEIFWKWYLLSNDDVKEYIKKIVGEGKKKIEKKEKRSEEKLEEKKIVKEKSFIRGKIRESQNIIKNEESGYLSKIDAYFENNQMYVISKELVRKNKELNFIADIPSNIGKLRYFIKFKYKQVVSDHDLISALDDASKKGLPLLFLSNGELNKKAEKYLNENVSAKLLFKKI